MAQRGPPVIRAGDAGQGQTSKVGEEVGIDLLEPDEPLVDFLDDDQLRDDRANDQARRKRGPPLEAKPRPTSTT